jgi:predicted transcriptional regulator
MIRTQISLTEEQKQRLDELSDESGRSLSELIRRAIDYRYGTHRTIDADLDRLQSGRGAWSDRGEDGAEYAERLRSGRRVSEA